MLKSLESLAFVLWNLLSPTLSQICSPAKVRKGICALHKPLLKLTAQLVPPFAVESQHIKPWHHFCDTKASRVTGVKLYH
jgi:hypothetical protein